MIHPITRTAHADERAIERFGHKFRTSRLLKKIKAGEAKFVGFGNAPGRLVYDVPHKIPGKEQTFVRVVCDIDAKIVITILPPSQPNDVVTEYRGR